MKTIYNTKLAKKVIRSIKKSGQSWNIKNEADILNTMMKEYQAENKEYSNCIECIFEWDKEHNDNSIEEFGFGYVNSSINVSNYIKEELNINEFDELKEVIEKGSLAEHIEYKPDWMEETDYLIGLYISTIYNNYIETLNINYTL